MNQFNNTTPKNGNDIDEMHNIEIPHKNKSLSLFHITACSLNNSFDDLQHLLSCTQKTFCYIIDFIVHVSSHICQSTLYCSCFISFAWVHTSLIMFHFYFLQSTVHLIHFTYHSSSCSCLPYLVVFILHDHSTSLSVSLSS